MLRELPWVRTLVVLAVIIAAYHYSLATLIRGLGLQTPLAYLGLVPVISLMLIGARALQPRFELDIHDRYLDYIIGIPLLTAALVTVVIVPVRLSTFFWLWRLDLLSLPLFVAGAIAITFGLRALWRVKLAVAFLFLAWPLPYVGLVGAQLGAFTNLTLSALKVVLGLLPLATPVPSPDGSLFSVATANTQFLLSVSSACSGVNGMVGFLLVGIGFGSLIRGRLTAKVAWVATGLFLIWILDIGRILFIFAAGHAWGEPFALGVLHPYIGLLAFTLGVLVMIVIRPLFGLRFSTPAEESGLAFGQGAAPSRRLAVKRARPALVILGLMGAIIAAGDARMQHFALVAQDLGPPRLHALSVTAAQVPGWSGVKAESYPWIARYFGNGATWDRFVYSARGDAGLSAPVTLDVISTTDLGAFSAFGVEACYRFHNYRVTRSSRVDLGAGVIGHGIIASVGPGDATWTAVYWEWPVQATGRQRYERVVLNMTQAGNPEPVAVGTVSTNLFSAVQLAVGDGIGGAYGHSSGAPERARDFLIGFGRAMVLATTNQASTEAELD